MDWNPKQILKILDNCCKAFTFPAMDNGYVYLAASRLTLFRSEMDWAVVIEVFGFSPRAGLPDTSVYTFGSSLNNRKTPEQYVNRKAYENYLKNNPNNEFYSAYPIAEGAWQDSTNLEMLAENATELKLRNEVVLLPSVDMYKTHGIDLQEQGRPRVFEICRFLAGTRREKVLGTSEERRTNVVPELQQILQLEEWEHPDIISNQLASDTEAFQQLSEALATGEVGRYRPSRLPNTHWRNWPEGGVL
jgi:hypothetical protein